jgi:hypothetical protein
MARGPNQTEPTDKGAASTGASATAMDRFRSLGRKLINVTRDELQAAQKRYTSERDAKRKTQNTGVSSNKK